MAIVTVNVWNKCQNKCNYCVSCAPNRYRDIYDDKRNYAEVIDVNRLILWLDKFRTNAEIHVSGGEPLLYSGIEDWIDTLLNSGRKVTILTNGQMIPTRKRLHDANIGWIVTYHVSAEIDPYLYLTYIEPLMGKKDVRLRILMRGRGDFEKLEELKKIFDGFSIWPKWVDGEKRSVRDFCASNSVDYIPENIASEYLTFVENNGSVYPCNSKLHGPVGNIYDMTFDEEKAREMDKRAMECYCGAWCGACNTAKGW